MVKVHPNGRINYKGQETRADGSHEASERAYEASLLVEKIAASGEDDEEMLEDALEKMLDAEIEDEQEGDDFLGGHDDYNDDEDDDENDDDNDEDGDDEDENGGNLMKVLLDTPAIDINTAIGSKRKVSPLSSSLSTSSLRHKQIKSTTPATRPDNFSRIYHSAALSEDAIKSKFPKFVEVRKKVIKIDLEEGDMLYIPAGWFHEVFSCAPSPPPPPSPPSSSSSSSSSASGTNTHMAFNYWFHPPDALSDFKNPYTSPFWSNVTKYCNMTQN